MSYLKIFLEWLPLLLFGGVMVYFLRKGGSQSQYIEHAKAYMTEHLAETKRLNANLERIAGLMERSGKQQQDA